MSNLVPEKRIRTEGIEVHVPADADQLWPGKIVEGKVVLEDLADLDNIGLRRGLSGRANLDSIVSRTETRETWRGGGGCTLRKNSANSSFWALAAATGKPVSFSVCRRKLLTSLRVARKLVALASLLFCPSYVLGSRLGKSFKATGRRNSAKGTMTKTENGTSRPRS